MFLWTYTLSHKQAYEQVLSIVVFNDCKLFFENLLQKDASVTTNRNLEKLATKMFKVSKNILVLLMTSYSSKDVIVPNSKICLACMFQE